MLEIAITKPADILLVASVVYLNIEDCPNGSLLRLEVCLDTGLILFLES